MSDTRDIILSIFGVQLTLLGMFISWIFTEGAIFFTGPLLAIIGTVIIMSELNK